MSLSLCFVLIGGGLGPRAAQAQHIAEDLFAKTLDEGTSDPAAVEKKQAKPVRAASPSTAGAVKAAAPPARARAAAPWTQTVETESQPPEAQPLPSPPQAGPVAAPVKPIMQAAPLPKTPAVKVPSQSVASPARALSPAAATSKPSGRLSDTVPSRARDVPSAVYDAVEAPQAAPPDPRARSIETGAIPARRVLATPGPLVQRTAGPAASESPEVAGTNTLPDPTAAAPGTTPGEEPTSNAPPAAVPPAAASPAAPASTPPPPQAAVAPPPTAVTVGLYINDIQDIDFRTNSYIVDLYLWFRWRGPDLDPVKTVEFMNVFDPQDAQKTVLLDAPKDMPDGSRYNILRYHGRFSKKFMLEKYPFDGQSLDFILEDSVAPQSEQIFAADTRAIAMNPAMSLPGFKFGTPRMDIVSNTYATDFGDLSAASAETYSRAVVSVPINRPVFTLAIKTFGPILLIVICATLVFFINPHFVEGRIGLAITALLTLVALQFTSASTLPDADYFTMLDKLYMLSYAFIISALVRVVRTSWHTVEGSLQDRAVSKGDQRWVTALLIIYGVITIVVASWVMAK